MVFTDMLPPTQSPLPEYIKHVIVLMLENRSFDHMLGYLDHPDPEFDGLKKSSYQDGHQPGATTMDARYSIYPGPNHSLEGTMHQLLGSKTIPSHASTFEVNNSGFAESYELRQKTQHANKGYGQKVMRCFNPAMLPVLSTLAKEFAVCDRWFSSAPMGTFPNRDFLHAGTAYGRSHNNPVPRDDQDTIFYRLQHANESWRHYSYRSSGAHLWTYPRLFTGNVGNHWEHTSNLVRDIKGGDLPTYSFVEPDYGDLAAGGGAGTFTGNSQHPSQADSLEEFVGGEALIAKIYAALATTPEVFNKTAFIVTYDEHGGFYDHVPPPAAVSPDTHYHAGTDLDGNDYVFKYNLLGPRVPAVIISPWIRRGKVDHTEYDHTSVYQTLRLSFCKNSMPATDRDGTANTFAGVFERQEPRALLPDDLLEHDGLNLDDYLPVLEPLSVEDARALENAFAAAPDETDIAPDYESDLRQALSAVPQPV